MGIKRFKGISYGAIPKRGDLIQHHSSTPQYANVVHKVEIVGDKIVIYSTRAVRILSGNMTYLNNTRARSFVYSRVYCPWSGWRIVTIVEEVERPADAAHIAAVLNNGFEQYVDPEDQDSEEDAEEDSEEDPED